jgi:hypothetical protein
VLEQQQRVQGSRWQLLRAAIVGLSSDVFVGRLFFGDPATGKVAWDCDCRPSDAYWLSLQVGQPRQAACPPCLGQDRRAAAQPGCSPGWPALPAGAARKLKPAGVARCGLGPCCLA